MNSPLPAGRYDITVTAGTEVLRGAIEFAGASGSCNAPGCFYNCSATLCGRVLGSLDGTSLIIVVNDGLDGEAGPSDFHLAIDYDGERLGEKIFATSYREEFPNGVDCPPVCQMANEQMTLSAPTSSSR